MKQIENRPHRQSLQRDLQKNNAYNPFSATSKKVIQDMDNVELFNSSRQTLKRSAKNAIWVQALSDALAGISWQKVKLTEAHRIYIGPFLIPNYVIELKRSVSKWTSLRKKTMDLAFSCVKSKGAYMCVRALPPLNTKCACTCVTKCVFSCVTKCVYTCVTKCVYLVRNGARFARLPLLASPARFFNRLN